MSQTHLATWDCEAKARLLEMSMMMPANGTIELVVLCKKPLAERGINDIGTMNGRFNVYNVALWGL